MGTDVIATAQQVQIATSGILTQLKATGIADGYDSLAHALEDKNLWEFVINQAHVVAQMTAFSVRDNAIINKLTHAGAYVKLEGVLDE